MVKLQVGSLNGNIQVLNKPVEYTSMEVTFQKIDMPQEVYQA
jgi:hypothetical protein